MNWYHLRKISNLHDNIEIVDFPKIKQTEEFSCGAAVLSSILTYYGKSVEEREIINQLGLHENHGAKEGEIVLYAKKMGFQVISKQMTTKDVIHFIDRSIPVIILIQAWSDKENPQYEQSEKRGHFVVAIGYNREGIYFEDPLLGHNAFLSYEDIDERWHGDQSDHIGIAIFKT